MNDLISRAEAIEAIASHDRTDGNTVCFTGKMVIGFINDLPSVKPTHTTPSNTLGTLDCVDRAEAIKAVKFYETFCDPYPRVIEALEELPSIQPDKDLIHLQKEQAYMQGYADGQKPREGKWIRWHETLEDASGVEYMPRCKCSECGKEYEAHSTRFINFCPNCGADMRGEQDGK